MSHSNIDPKDLRLLKISELVIGGMFYRKESDGTYSSCVITHDDLKRDGVRVREETKRLASEKRLYVRINKPFSSFA